MQCALATPQPQGIAVPVLTRTNTVSTNFSGSARPKLERTNVSSTNIFGRDRPELTTANVVSTNILAEKIIGELEKVIEKTEKHQEKIEPDDTLLETLPKLQEIIDPENQLKLERIAAENQKMIDEFNLIRLYQKIQNGAVSRELEFYFGGLHENFFKKRAELDLDAENVKFIDFLSSDFAQQMF